MKADARILGFDDGPFTWDDSTVPVIGVVARGGGYVEGVLRTEVEVDGDDATDALATSVARSRFRDEIRAILLDGIALGGFNVVDLDALHERTRVPVLAVTQGEPDLAAMEDALRRHVDGAERKVAILRRHAPRMYPTEGKPIGVRCVGMAERDVPALLAATTIRGLVPEPLRLAHLVATAYVEGESRGL